MGLFRRRKKEAGPACSAVVVAAGASSRMGFDKVLAEVGGVPVIVRCLEAFQQAPSVAEVVVVTRADWVRFAPPRITLDTLSSRKSWHSRATSGTSSSRVTTTTSATLGACWNASTQRTSTGTPPTSVRILSVPMRLDRPAATITAEHSASGSFFFLRNRPIKIFLPRKKEPFGSLPLGYQ